MYHPLVTANMKNDLIRRAEPEGNKGTVEGGGFPSQLKYGLDLHSVLQLKSVVGVQSYFFRGVSESEF